MEGGGGVLRGGDGVEARFELRRARERYITKRFIDSKKTIPSTQKLSVMNTIKKFMSATAVVMACVVAGTLAGEQAEACTRIVYTGQDGLYIVARSLDWKNPIPTNVYVYPRGMKKVGSDLPGAIDWVSTYGAVYAVGYDAGVTEGMNEKGLVVNGLFCKDAVYANATNDKRPPISLAMFPAWMLDQCATTAEVKQLLQSQDFYLYGATFDGGTASVLHWEVTDRTGASMIIEFDGGDIRLYDVDVAAYPCMTNDPMWPDMMAIINYWEKIGGEKALPGSVSSPDRCVRGTFFAKHVDAVSDADLGAAIAVTLINNCSVPYTYHTSADGEPNVSMTQWRSFSNLRDLRYYFEPVEDAGLWYVDLTTLDLYPGAPVLKIDTSKMQKAIGNQNHALKRVEPFTPRF